MPQNFDHTGRRGHSTPDRAQRTHWQRGRFRVPGCLARRPACRIDGVTARTATQGKADSALVRCGGADNPGGLYLLVDAIYWHPDAQSAIGIVLTPALQAIAFLFVSLPASWSSCSNG